MTVPQFVRYPIAIVAGAILGEVASLPVAVFLDIVSGYDATGGRCPLTAPNVILACVKGLITGYSAGWIAKKRGKLVGAASNFLVLTSFVVFSIAINTDLMGLVEAKLDTKPALWVWIALIPAIIGGDLGMQHGSKGLRYLVGLF
jgi:hypothetical protein